MVIAIGCYIVFGLLGCYLFWKITNDDFYN